MIKTPSSKHQHPEKLQTSTSKQSCASRVLVLGAWNFSGAWRLLLGAFPKQQPQAVHHYDHGAAFVADHAEGQWDFPQHRKRHQHHDGAERDEKILPDDGAGALAQTERSEEIDRK